MENIYFQPNKENSEFLAKLEKLDEYTIPQILERMVDHFRTLPELEDALNKLGIKTDSLKDEEELDDDIRVEKRFWVGGKPKKLRHFKGDNPTPILVKEWYKNGQLKSIGTLQIDNTLVEHKYWSEDGKLEEEQKQQSVKVDGVLRWKNLLTKIYYSNGQIAKEQIGFEKPIYYDEDGNTITESKYKTFITVRDKVN
jgi:hypothetical protein